MPKSIDITPTIQLSEVVWLLACLPGLIIWTLNLKMALKDRKVTRLLYSDRGDPALLWSNYSVADTRLFVIVEWIFVFVGAFYLTQLPDNSTLIVRWTVVGLFVYVAVSITRSGLMWRSVDRRMKEIAKRKVDERQ
jgi:hypothetical protein